MKERQFVLHKLLLNYLFTFSFLAESQQQERTSFVMEEKKAVRFHPAKGKVVRVRVTIYNMD